MKLANLKTIQLFKIFASSNERIQEYKVDGEKDRHCTRCLEIARANPELCAEEVEYKAVLAQIGLFPQ